MATGKIVELQDIEVTFGGRRVLDGFSLTVEPGQRLSLVGESSSGKSTVLKVMVGLIRPDRGQVRIFGRDLGRLGQSELRRVRQRLGMQFQSGALFDSMSVLENLQLARRECALDAPGRARADNREEIVGLLAQVGLASAADRYPFELSGGMRKRAALARALTTRPLLAIFDEPTAGLDPVTSRRIINLVAQAGSEAGGSRTGRNPAGLEPNRAGAADGVGPSQASGRRPEPPPTMILATTDIQVARHFSPELLILNQGRLWAHDHIDRLQHSSDEFTHKLLSRLI